MSEMLHMCGLMLPGHLASKVQSNVVQRNIPFHLQYACRNWVHHLAKCGKIGLKDGGKVHALLLDKFLFWLETMSLIGHTLTTVLIMNHLEALVSVSYLSTMSISLLTA